MPESDMMPKQDGQGHRPGPCGSKQSFSDPGHSLKWLSSFPGR